MAKRVLVGKIDLDTCGAACLLGVSREDEVEVLRSGQATEEDLANPKVLCIEVGGSGRVSEGNFDHHGEGAEGLASATKQAQAERQRPVPPGLVNQLVDYIDKLDTKGPEALGPRRQELFPTLSELFSGMLLSEKNPVEQLFRGIVLLKDVVCQGIDPFGKIPCKDVSEGTAYVRAKLVNDENITRSIREAEWGTTSSGLKLAWLETDFIGAPGALYGAGAQVVVAFSPCYGPSKVPKFTVAGNGIRVDKALAELNAREPGWGGPPSGTIVGSPREGSKLTLSEVVAVVREVL